MKFNSKKKQEAIRTYVRFKPIPSYEEPTLISESNSVSVIKTQDSYTYGMHDFIQRKCVWLNNHK